MNPSLKLVPRTTYRNNRGDEVCIAGLAQSDLIEGERIFWSIQGDWYSETGRFVGTRREPTKAPEPGRGPFDYTPYLYPLNHPRSLNRVEDTDAARRWWAGVKTHQAQP